LKLGDKFFWGIVFPTAALGILSLMPYLDVTPSRRYAHRRFMLTLAMLTVSLTTVLSYMGLPEFAVATSAETEILHELSMEPAHNHVGIMRTVPFDQLAPGAYTTHQLGTDDPAGAVNHFSADLFVRQVFDASQGENGVTVSEYDFLENRLVTTDHLSVVPSAFRQVPDNSPVLMRVLKVLEEDLHERALELPGAWGGIIITPYQEGLARVDLVIVWDGVVIESGRVQVDETGEPLPLMVTDENGNLVRERRIYTKHLYIHEDAAYFD
jgi:hypothetical protein